MFFMIDLSICHVNLARGFRGGERQTELLITHLAPLVKKQYLVCRKNSPLKEHLSNISNLEIVEVYGRINGHLKRIDSDIINAHEAKAVHWALIENQLYHTPYVITRRVPQVIKKGMLNTKTYGSAAALVGISSPITAYLKTMDNPHVVTINSALSHMTYDQNKTDEIKQLFPGKKIIGHIGAYVDRHKGQRVIIEAARILQKKRDDLVFLCLGDGTDRDALQEESKDIPSIKWVGFQKDVGSYLKSFDLFVFPSRNEGLGSTLLDVMDYEIPIVATKVDGIPDIVIDGKTGLLIQNGDAVALAEKIEILLANSELADKLVSNAKERLALFQPEHMAAQYLDLYQKILNK